MSTKRIFLILLGIAMAVATTAAQASLTFLGGGSGNPSLNLVTNGSFENGAPGPAIGSSNARLWATGTSQNFLPFEVPAGWTSAGLPGTYATWGNDDPPPAYKLRGSDLLPDGQNGMYFGNGSTTVNLAPTFNANGTVTFSGIPIMTPAFGGPATLSQTINTQLSPAPKYTLSFWVSGEGAYQNPSGTNEGVFGLKLTNVLPGNPIQFLTVPAGGGPQGASRYYEYEFVPLNPTLPVDLTFINWGHFDLTPFNGPFTTELVLDQVVINSVPEPSTFVLVGCGIFGFIALSRPRKGAWPLFRSKRVAIGRKNWLFAGNDAAAENHARLWSLIASAERHAVDPQAYLTSLLAKIGQTPQEELGQFLPDVWKGEDARTGH